MKSKNEYTLLYKNVVYSKVPPLRNCVIRNSGLILLNETPQYKDLCRLIHIQFLLTRYKSMRWFMQLKNVELQNDEYIQPQGFTNYSF